MLAKMHLTQAELADLTDRALPSKQIEWLRRNGWKFAVSAAGKPKVARAFYDFKLGTAASEPENESHEPDFSSWKNDGRQKKKEPRTGHEPAVCL